jgi:hypothetical protein
MMIIARASYQTRNSFVTEPGAKRLSYASVIEGSRFAPGSALWSAGICHRFVTCKIQKQTPVLFDKRRRLSSRQART